MSAEDIPFNDLIRHLPLERKGLEISPLFRPGLLKTQYNVDYTDYLPTRELQYREKGHPDGHKVVELDFVWNPFKRLKHCTKTRYDYVIARHVWEHVPNPIGWLEQVLEVCKTGAIITLVLPTKYNPIDFLRSETDISEIVAAYLEDRKTPSARQIFDAFYHRKITPLPINKTLYTAEEVRKMPHHYSFIKSLGRAYSGYKRPVYIDIHCSIFNLKTLPKIIWELRELGFLNVEVIETSSAKEDAAEFFIKLRKLEPKDSNLFESIKRWERKFAIRQMIKGIIGVRLTDRIKEVFQGNGQD